MDYYLSIRDIQTLGMLSCVLSHHSLPDSFKPPKSISKPDIIPTSKSFTFGSSPSYSDPPSQVNNAIAVLIHRAVFNFGEWTQTSLKTRFILGIAHVVLARAGRQSAFSRPFERFHSRDQHLCKFVGTKEIVYLRKEFSSHRICLKHQHGRRFIVSEFKYGRRDVM